jgi:hypothetical protein
VAQHIPSKPLFMAQQSIEISKLYSWAAGKLSKMGQNGIEDFFYDKGSPHRSHEGKGYFSESLYGAACRSLVRLSNSQGVHFADQ